MIWDKWNVEHIKKHNVTITEVEEGYKQAFLQVRKPNKKVLLLSRIHSGRALTIILSFKYQKRPYILSARDMSKKERRLYLYEKNRQ